MLTDSLLKDLRYPNWVKAIVNTLVKVVLGLVRKRRTKVAVFGYNTWVCPFMRVSTQSCTKHVAVTQPGWGSALYVPSLHVYTYANMSLILFSINHRDDDEFAMVNKNERGLALFQRDANALGRGQPAWRLFYQQAGKFSTKL